MSYISPGDPTPDNRTLALQSMHDLGQSELHASDSLNQHINNVVVFGDLNTAFEFDLSRLLQHKANPNFQNFLDRVGLALRQEFATLSAVEQGWFPSFTTIPELLEKFDSLTGAPALRLVLLVVYQIGRVIKYFGEGSHVYPNAKDTCVFGICAGAFAGAAISAARTITELIPVAVETVLVAFRTGIHAVRVQRNFEQPAAEESRSWAAIVHMPEIQASELLDKYNASRNLPITSRLYISCVSPNTVTLSGQPVTIKEFIESESLKASYLKIEAPYHAPHLHTLEDVQAIVGDHGSDLPSFMYSISPATGQWIKPGSFRDLLLRATWDALCEPVRWDKVLQTLHKAVSRPQDESDSTQQKSFTIMPVASSSASFIKGKLDGASINVESGMNDRLEAPTEKSAGFSNSPIAIVGFSGRFPDAASNEQFWELLRAGRDVHRPIPKNRFDWEAHYDPEGKIKNTSRIKHGCFIEEPGLFDARFFNISPAEAERVDPAQRLLLLATYEAMEMAGFVPNRTPSTQHDRVGVYMGVTSDDWREINSAQNIGTYFIPGGNRAFVPGRISYFFRFTGPSISVDTACSSSFAAIHTACAALWRGECDTAIGGGVNILTNPDNFAGLDRGHFLSTTGNCNSFDDEANGYCRSDGVGSVIFKRLEDALADKDPIFGIIAGAATNHSGHTESITRPNDGDQYALFRSIMRQANVDPLDVGLVEMHGTGTQHGDATEMRSVLAALVPGKQRNPGRPLYLGAVKANVGHAESASGVLSLIKVLLMMKNNEIPPHCGIKTRINHNYPLDLKERNVHIAMEPTPWKASDWPSGKRTCFLNNFSAAGGNTALLLQDGPAIEAPEVTDPRKTHVITLSAKSAKSLVGNIKALELYLKANPSTSLSMLSYTTTARRMHHRFRILVSAADTAALEGKLNQKAKEDLKTIPPPPKVPKVVFTFTGQGALYPGLGKQLFEESLFFKETLLQYDRLCQQQGFGSVLPYVTDTTEGEANSTVTSHLAALCVQMALSCLWRSWGITPSATIGHSLGEYAALFASGVISSNAAIYLVGFRAKLLSENCTESTHAMLAVRAAVDAITPSLKDTSCEVACLNQPTNNVISGPRSEILRLKDIYESQGHRAVLLDIPYAFHSSQVDPILEKFEEAAQGVRFKKPSIPYLSSLKGKVITEAGMIDPAYVSKACRSPVNYQGAVEAAIASGTVANNAIWLEIGAHPANCAMIKGTIGEATAIPTLKKGEDTWKTMANALETLYTGGIEISWNEYHRGLDGAQQVLQLPAYAWDLKNYWLQYVHNWCITKGDDPNKGRIEAVPKTVPTPSYKFISPSVQRVIDEDVGSKSSSLLIESDIHDPRLKPIVAGHKVNSAGLCPSSLYADIALTMAQYMIKQCGMWTDSIGLDCSDMKAENPLVFSDAETSQLLRVSANADWARGEVRLKFFGHNNKTQRKVDHATATVIVTSNQRWVQEWKRHAYLIESRIESLHEAVDRGNAHKLKSGLAYLLFSKLVDYEQRYKGMQEVILDSDKLEATSRVVFQVPNEGYVYNPCWIDSLGHIAGFIMNGNDNIHSKDQVFINHGWDHVRFAEPLEAGKEYTTYNRMQLVNKAMYAGDTYILDGNNVVGMFEGVRFQGVPRKVLDNLLPSNPKSAPTQPAAKLAPKKQPTHSPAEPAATVPTKAATAPPAALEQKLKVAKSEASPVTQVRKIIIEEAGVDDADLGPTAEFADCGIDSLLSLSISSRIKEEIGLDLGSAVFSEHPTMQDLTKHLEGRMGEAPASTESLTESATPMTTLSDSDTSVNTGVTTPESTSGDFTMEVIKSTIAEETGVEPTDLAPSTSLSEIGMDSLMSLNVISTLNEKLDVQLPSTLFADNDTINDVETTLVANNVIQRSTTVPEKPKQQVEQGPHATSVLLQGSAKNSKHTIFLFPDGSGSATSYALIPTISDDVAVYGLNCPWMRNPTELKCTMSEYAAKFISEIQRRQAKGPYIFGGWSAGGIVAYEAAQQLTKAGEKVTKLILLDSPNPIGLENPPQRMYDFFEQLDFFGMNGKAPPSWLRPHFDAFIKMLDAYKVSKFSSHQVPDAYMLYAKDGICKGPDDPKPEIRPDDPREMLWLLNNRTDFSGAGWLDLLGKDKLKVDTIENVNHFTMLQNGKHMEKLVSFMKKSVL
ncbi:putative polyketide synthase [Piedraia hortae CBS 480.64]|uniref:Putative polyketide synthase n=1 Tax=Piedraia hortae CBS 480.64 TaxID=1314780 RepID=A0A6A7BTN3_9PEZI|nr:putative polyketide synthase [Piedraia hortae CBS 480.64]